MANVRARWQRASERATRLAPWQEARTPQRYNTARIAHRRRA
jgi:hypothetical protein